MYQRLCSERCAQSGAWEFPGCFSAITEHWDSSGSLLTCRFLPPPHRDGDSVDMVQGGARNLRLKNTPPTPNPKEDNSSESDEDSGQERREAQAQE